MTTITIDSYSETNKDDNIRVNGAARTKVGQAFQAPSSATLTQSKFYLTRTGSPTGNVTSSLFACTGIPGSTGKGTGTALATSDPINVTTVSAAPTYALTTFTFSTPYSIVSGTNYVIVVEFSGGDDTTNYISAGLDSSAPTHAGNTTVYLPPNWDYWELVDTCFYVYGTTGWTHKFMGIANASISKINGISIANIAKVNGI